MTKLLWHENSDIDSWPRWGLCTEDLFSAGYQIRLDVDDSLCLFRLSGPGIQADYFTLQDAQQAGRDHYRLSNPEEGAEG